MGKTAVVPHVLSAMRDQWKFKRPAWGRFRDCGTPLIVLCSCLGSTLGPSLPAATAEMTEPEPLMSVECRCRCNCERRPNRRITCEGCNRGVGPGCCARNAEGGMPEIGATTCICHRCLEEGPPPQPNPQEEKELRMAAVVRVVHPCELDNCSCQRTTLPCLCSRRGKAATS